MEIRKRRVLTPEAKARIERKNEEWAENLDVNYQLGHAIGELIVYRFLPTLSIDIFKTNKVIQVSDEDTKIYELIYSKRFNNHNKDDKTIWKEYIQIYKNIVEKYFPPVLECYIDSLNINKDNVEFKNGLIRSLWNCDVCQYSLKAEDIEISREYGSCITLIKFKLDSSI